MFLTVRQIDKANRIDLKTQHQLRAPVTTIGRAVVPFAAGIPHINIGSSFRKVSRFHFCFYQVDGVFFVKGGPPSPTERQSPVTAELHGRFEPRLLKAGDVVILYSDSRELSAAGEAVYVEVSVLPSAPEEIAGADLDTVPPPEEASGTDAVARLEQSVMDALLKIDAHMMDCSQATEELEAQFSAARSQHEANLLQVRADFEAKLLERSDRIDEVLRAVSKADNLLWKMAVFAISVSLGSFLWAGALDGDDSDRRGRTEQIVHALEVLPPLLSALGLGVVAMNAGQTSKESLQTLAGVAGGPNEGEDRGRGDPLN